MSKTPAPSEITSTVITNNPSSGLMDIQVGTGSGSLDLSIHPLAAIHVVNLLILRLLELRDEEVTMGLQNFALKDIQAGQTPAGHLYLKYWMENGLGFGTGFPREKLVNLHKQLGVILANSEPDSGSARHH